MWPWEHAALGYLLYSLGWRATGRDPPTASETLLVVVASQLPDLIDKPLAWGLGWFPSGFAIAHAALLVGPLAAIGLWVARRSGHWRAGLAVVVGWGSHLVGDVASPLRAGDGLAVERVAWPVATIEPYETDYGLARGLVYLEALLEGATMGAGTIGLTVGLAATTLAVWAIDGRPGLGAIRAALDRRFGDA